MKTKASPSVPARASTVRLLLPQFCPVSLPACDLDPRHLSLRAVAVTSLLASIVEQRGYFHWGINE